MTAGPPAPALRWAVHALEGATTRRRRTEERLRAVLTGADARWPTAAPLDGAAARALLAAVRAGRTLGPVPVLGALLRLRHVEEAEARRRVAELVAGHPAWPWLATVRGVGPIVAGRLLARLDVTRAATPSAFVAYCGLAPRPASRWRCAACGASARLVDGRVPGPHGPPPAPPARGRPGGVSRGSACRGPWRRVGRGGRMAQPPAARGESATFDRRAKVACHLLARAWVRHGGAYGDYYRAQRLRRDHQCPAWSDARRRLTALRAAQQAFLAHLWTAWRQALGLSTVAPYAEGRLGLPPFPVVRAAADG